MLLTLLLEGTVAAQAPEEEPVQLSIADCEHAPASVTRKLVAIELGTRGLRVARAEEHARVQARLQCSQTHASIVVADDRRDSPFELELSLLDTPPEARARFLALALAELLATNELERLPSQPAEQREAELQPTAATAPLRSVFWLAAGGMLAYEPSLLSPELQLGAAVGFGRFSLQLDADFAWSTRRSATEALHTRLLSFALAPGIRLFDGTLAWDVAAGMRTGLGRLAADATAADEEGRTLSAWMLAPLVQTALAIRLAAAWRVQLALELDYIVKPLRGLSSDGTTLIALRGLRASLLLGIRFTLGE